MKLLFKKKKKQLEKWLTFVLVLPAKEILTKLVIISFSFVQNLFNLQALLPRPGLDLQETLLTAPFGCSFRKLCCAHNLIQRQGFILGSGI